jgi:hypothetical protein
MHPGNAMFRERGECLPATALNPYSILADRTVILHGFPTLPETWQRLPW